MKKSERKAERKNLIQKQPISDEQQSKLIGEFMQEVVMASEYYDAMNTNEAGNIQPKADSTMPTKTDFEIKNNAGR